MMARIVLIPDDCRSKAVYLESCELPDFYMEDFSIQGFSVDRYDEARELLRRTGYTLLDKRVSADILIDRVEQVRTIHSLFEQNGIQAQLTDIADTIYQA
jgi:hypothetical protein